MICIIAGSRDLENYELIAKAHKASGFNITKILNGAARGVDKNSTKYAVEQRIPYEEYPAKWHDFSEPCIIKYHKNGNPYNALAGNRRNTEMLKLGQALIAIRKPKNLISRGTDDMIKQAKAKGIPVFIYYVEDTTPNGLFNVTF